ncbi:GNAT family N-acetyltransferase [Duncaniella dubosii]|uniref:GNAT family N-acetyltransferase n=2 Tax=Duncaniella TaxID=2518495 RepID=A0A4P7W6J4_9BACT|nr:GNAT family N-acetyltransferase [Duncaniella dubosii]QCD43015.1 GNAT family N-acetyltransferase [Duncaniella dubosii]
MNLTLRPYQPADAVIITSWLKSEYLMRQWCADRYEHYPVTPEDMNSYHERYIDGQRSHALTMTDDDEIVGYITLRTPAEDTTEQRLGFVIVDDSKRGIGLGKALVSMAVKYAFETLGATRVSLGVFDNNPAAIHCYEAAGFHRVSRQDTESYPCLGETWNCIEMGQYADAIIRDIKSDEIPLLTEFLYEAIFQPQDAPKVSRIVLQEPMIWAYVNGFGSRTGDFCRVAIIGGAIVGAAWSRLGCSYGKVDASIPELAISLYPEYRGRGIGSRLLESLLNTLCENGYKKVSLSVDKTNYAVSIYRKFGFETIVEREHDYLMVNHLNRR